MLRPVVGNKVAMQYSGELSRVVAPMLQDA